MAVQPDGGTPGKTGSDGDGENVDLRALAAQVERNSHQLNLCGERLNQCEERYERLVTRLRRMAKFNERELAQLLAE